MSTFKLGIHAIQDTSTKASATKTAGERILQEKFCLRSRSFSISLGASIFRVFAGNNSLASLMELNIVHCGASNLRCRPG